MYFFFLKFESVQIPIFKEKESHNGGIVFHNDIFKCHISLIS